LSFGFRTGFTSKVRRGMEMDLLDSQLIDILMQDANTSSSVLAKKLNVSSSTIRRRKENLLKQGMIRILAVPDWNKVGLPLAAIIALEVSSEKTDSVFKALSKYQNSTWIAVTSGRFNIVSLWRFGSTEELYKFIGKEISKLERIIRSEIFVGLYVEKHL
jgi:Lrp/AsnC family transcriptional regulator for asnA, asnC and gidA